MYVCCYLCDVCIQVGAVNWNCRLLWLLFSEFRHHLKVSVKDERLMFCIMSDQSFHVSGVTFIGYAAFFDTRLTSVIIPGYDICILTLYTELSLLLIAMYVWYATQDGVDHWR